MVVYLDDILIFSENAADHAKHLRKVLQVVQDNKLKCKLKKCAFNKLELKFLHILLVMVDSRQILPRKSHHRPAQAREHS